MFLTSPNLSQINHGFFTRNGGVSEGIYSSLNCGWGSADSQEHIAENRRRVAATLGTTLDQFCSLYQVHGAKVITVTTPWPRDALPQADAMVTKEKQIAIGVLAADCVPVLFADGEAGVIGAAHAGWKGALAGVLEATTEAMCALGAKRSNITAAIGPCIAQASYEVGQEFYDTLVKADGSYASLFAKGVQSGHWQFDIKAYARKKLGLAGVKSIYTLENNTYLEEDNFFSFRRTTHRAEKDYGRQVSAIRL